MDFCNLVYNIFSKSVFRTDMRYVALFASSLSLLPFLKSVMVAPFLLWITCSTHIASNNFTRWISKISLAILMCYVTMSSSFKLFHSLLFVEQLQLQFCYCVLKISSQFPIESECILETFSHIAFSIS